MGKDFELSGDMNLDTMSDTSGDTSLDFGGDLASETGTNLNEQPTPTHAELTRGYAMEAMHAAGEKLTEIGQKVPPSTPGGYYSQFAEVGASMIKPLGQAAGHGISAIMEPYGNPKAELNNMEIQQAIENGAKLADEQSN